MQKHARIRILYLCVVIGYETLAGSPDMFSSRSVTGQTWTRLFGISLEQCKEECDSRKVCASANYARKKLLCELNMGANGGRFRLDLIPGYVGFRKSGIHQKYRECLCSMNEKCTVTESGTVSCSTAECERSSFPDTMVTVFGNMNSLGSKSVMQCKSIWRASEVMFLPPFVTQCDLRGIWTGFDERKCGKEVFMVKPGIGGARGAWRGRRMFTNDTSCSRIVSGNTSCSLHFRDDDIDQWESLNISLVLMSVYKNEEDVHYVLFNGSGSDSKSWFSQGNILSSTWLDITTVPANHFNINGLYENRYTCGIRRRFCMAVEWGGCWADAGWFVWTNPTNKACCDWDTLENHADILYSTGQTFAVFDHRHLIGRADFFTVVIFTN